jgi:histidinol-phosphate/aromatic aminotransferase/cobyric acid decarboxylase-like protein
MPAICRKTVFATDVWFDESKIYVRLTDGREVGVPIDWYPRLRDASEEDLANAVYWARPGNPLGNA